MNRLNLELKWLIFQCKSIDPTGLESKVSQKRERWILSFELYITAKKISKDKRKQVLLLLYLAGEKVEDIWFTLPKSQKEGSDKVYYSNSLEALNKYFLPHKKLYI